MTITVAARWQTRAACAAKPAGWWFPTAAGRGSYVRARAICAQCPVTAECLNDAMRAEASGPDAAHRAGMWGGLSPLERERLAMSPRSCLSCGRQFRSLTGAVWCSQACSPARGAEG